MNVLEDAAGLTQLQALGARSVPVLARGNQFTFAQSTKQIVEFLDLPEEAKPELPLDELVRRLDKFMAAALQLLPLMPEDRLATHVPGRPRSYRSLAFHLFRVVDAFLDANNGITLMRAMFAEEPAPDADTGSLLQYGGTIRQRFEAWRMSGDVAADKILPTYYGPQSRHELLERTTWHCGQHVRQWMMLLEREGVSHPAPLVAADFKGLPMPQNVWDG